MNPQSQFSQLAAYVVKGFAFSNECDQVDRVLRDGEPAIIGAGENKQAIDDLRKVAGTARSHRQAAGALAAPENRARSSPGHG
ncbi:MAG: hypothetical protein H0X34_01450 [Chthoniobacterales bacterium]|nr:hypothetical protein [Chthoniobacterales bacterium]